MKKIAIIAGVIVAVVAVVVVLLPALVPAERIKSELVARVKAATGRDLVIGGPVSVSVLPRLSLTVTGVALSSPPGFRSPELARLGSLEVRLGLMPLLSGRIEVDSFVLGQPVITLERDGAGHGNWEFAPTAKPAAPAAGGAPTGATGGAAAPPSVPGDIRLGDVRIVDGRFSYIDDKSGSREGVESVDFALTLDSLDRPLSARGGLTWHGQPVRLELEVATPRGVIEGRGSTAGVKVAAEPVQLSFSGDLTAAGGVAGALALSSPSLRGLAGWAGGKPLAFAGGGLGPLSIKARVAAAGGTVALTEAALALDSVRANGELTVVTGGARPTVRGRLDVGALDLSPYLPPEGGGGGESRKPAAGGAGGGGGAAAASGDWSDAPIDASALKAADADLTLTVAGITLRRLVIGRSALGLALHDGRLAADLTELRLYGGAARGRLVADGSRPGVGLEAAGSLKGLDAASFLAVFGFGRLEGTGNADIQLAGGGATQRQIVASLAGKGGVSFLNGAIRGINLAAMARNLTTAFTDTGGVQKTDFAELSGTAVIRNGIVTNNDLALKSPLLRVTGAGTVDLPRRTVTYRLDPKLAATLQGQGGAGNVGGLDVPVIVEGRWDALSFRPDLEALAKGAAGKAVTNVLKGQGLPQIIPKGLPLPVNPGKLFGN